MKTNNTFINRYLFKFIKRTKDEFNDEGYMNYFRLNQIVIIDLDLNNHLVFLEFGNGELEVSANKGKVFSIYYITSDQDEFEASFIRIVEEFINIELTNFLRMNEFLSIH